MVSYDSGFSNIVPKDLFSPFMKDMQTYPCNSCFSGIDFFISWNRGVRS